MFCSTRITVTPSSWMRSTMPNTVLASLARRRLPAHASRQQAVRHGEIRRLALALRDAGRALATNRTELARSFVGVSAENSA